MMDVKGSTKLLGVIGNPIEHSLSPVFQNYLIRKSKLNYIYIPLKIDLKGVTDFLRGLRNVGNLRGLNVTIPFKEIVSDYLDNVSEEAKKIGAVNTILIEDNKFYGYNTDVYGIIYTLKMKLKINDLKECLIVMLGAGGASKAAIWSIHGMGAKKILVVNRTVNRFKRLNDWAKKNLNLELDYLEWNKLGQLIKIVKPDLIINSTPLGLKGEKIGLDFENIKKELKFFDMTYSLKANYLKSISREYSFVYTDGFPMLVAQGVESFRIWTGMNFNIEKVLKYLMSRLMRCQRF